VALQELFSDVRQQFAGKPESVLRENLYERIFQVLGWRWEIEKPPQDDKADPDFRLITTEGTEIPCLTYVWDRFLDASVLGEMVHPRNFNTLRRI
jgi:hypothetical protein